MQGQPCRCSFEKHPFETCTDSHEWKLNLGERRAGGGGGVRVASRGISKISQEKQGVRCQQSQGEKNFNN